MVQSIDNWQVARDDFCPSSPTALSQFINVINDGLLFSLLARALDFAKLHTASGDAHLAGHGSV